MLTKKAKLGAPTEAQRVFHHTMHEACNAAKLLNKAYRLGDIPAHKKEAFFNVLERMAPQLAKHRRVVWERLGKLQNRRKYVKDKSCGKRPLKGSVHLTDTTSPVQPNDPSTIASRPSAALGRPPSAATGRQDINMAAPARPVSAKTAATRKSRPSAALGRPPSAATGRQDIDMAPPARPVSAKTAATRKSRPSAALGRLPFAATGRQDPSASVGMPSSATTEDKLHTVLNREGVLLGETVLLHQRDDVYAEFILTKKSKGIQDDPVNELPENSGSTLKFGDLAKGQMFVWKLENVVSKEPVVSKPDSSDIATTNTSKAPVKRSKLVVMEWGNG